MAARVELVVDDAGDLPLAVTALQSRAAQMRSAAERAAAELLVEQRKGTDTRTGAAKVMGVLGEASRLDDVARRLAAALVLEETDGPDPLADLADGNMGGDDLPADPQARATVIALRAAVPKDGRPVDPDALVPAEVAAALGLVE